MSKRRQHLSQRMEAEIERLEGVVCYSESTNAE